MRVKAYGIYRKSFPFYRYQYWDNKAMAWHDIQKRFNNPIEAQLYREGLGFLCRVMVVPKEGRLVYGG